MFAQTIRANISPVEQTELRQLCLITDGNAHRPDLLRTADISSGHADVVSEALLPEIRSTAMLIAVSRHDWNAPTPDVFADEAEKQGFIAQVNTWRQAAQKQPAPTPDKETQSI